MKGKSLINDYPVRDAVAKLIISSNFKVYALPQLVVIHYDLITSFVSRKITVN